MDTSTLISCLASVLITPLILFGFGLPLIDAYYRPRPAIIKYFLLSIFGFMLIIFCLVGLASCFQNFHPAFYLVIASGLGSLFLLFKRLPIIRKRIQEGEFYKDFTQFERNINEGKMEMYSTKHQNKATKSGETIKQTGTFKQNGISADLDNQQ
ncbi:MAG: hypothetical protein SFU25_07530 [Candidatus Caenarcaniphilales bacterium]|nr:hypothetical protein [Candidatus Caenarcaniphilales bacterium]